jgi:hypothetical protein
MSSESSSGNGRPPSPIWLDAIRRLERAVGRPAERWLTSDTYFDLLPYARRAQAQLEATVAAMTEEWYRLMNVPTGSDLRQMRTQLARMERQLQRMAKALEDARAEAETPTAQTPDETD